MGTCFPINTLTWDVSLSFISIKILTQAHITVVAHGWQQANNIHVCWFNFDDPAQRNSCKATKEPINCHGSSGDRTHYPQTETTPPAARCSAHSFHATEIVSKTQSQWLYILSVNFDALAQGKPTNEPINCRGSSGDLTHYLQTGETPHIYI